MEILLEPPHSEMRYLPGKVDYVGLLCPPITTLKQKFRLNANANIIRKNAPNTECEYG